jgi:hypothetical protein
MRLYSLSTLLMLTAGGPSPPSDDEGMSDRIDALERLVDAQRTQILLLHDMIREARSLTGNNSARITRLNSATGDFADLTEVIYLDDAGDVVVDGANLRIVNGTGRTHQLNGFGNLLIGYDAECSGCDRVGSHNIVLGIDNVYSSHSGLVNGTENNLLEAHAAVLGGSSNTASDSSVCIGGTENDAIGFGSVVIGGSRNQAKGHGSIVVGGVGKIADERYGSQR